MLNLKHSPGVWYHSETGVLAWPMGIGKCIKIINNTLIDNLVNENIDFNRKDMQAQENANVLLIAEAPKMLNFLIKAFPLLEAMNFEDIDLLQLTLENATDLPIEEIIK